MLVRPMLRVSNTVVANRLVTPGLPSLPVEISVEIFSVLPTLYEVFNFAATCHSLRRVWTENAGVIYASVGPRAIQCERYARIFLKKQEGRQMNPNMLSALDVWCIVKNARVVDQVIMCFETRIVSRIKGIDNCEKFYGSRQRPSKMTQTERPRFIKSVYRLWRLMMEQLTSSYLDFTTISLRDLFYVKELAEYVRHNNYETGGFFSQKLLPFVPGTNSVSQLDAGYKSDAREDLGTAIWDEIKERYQRAHPDTPTDPTGEAIYLGYLSFVVFFDHYQPNLKSIVCGTYQHPQNQYQAHLWTEDSGEE